MHVYLDSAPQLYPIDSKTPWLYIRIGTDINISDHIAWYQNHHRKFCKNLSPHVWHFSIKLCMRNSGNIFMEQPPN